MSGRAWVLITVMVAALFAFASSVTVVNKAVAGEPPETIEIKELKNLYGPVEFPHSDHFDYADDCSVCHHHSEGKTISCKVCHKPFKVYKYEGSKRINGLGLKGAYHGRCLGCHKEEGGPVGCTECHERAKKPVPNYTSEKE